MLRVPIDLGTREPEDDGFCVRLSDETSNYVCRVRRLKPGAELLLFDARSGTRARARLRVDEEGRARCWFERVEEVVTSNTFPIWLFQGIGKGQKLDESVRAATALRVSRVCGVFTARSVVQYKGADASHRLATRHERLDKIATEAARQCGRVDVPQVEPLRSLSEVLSETRQSAESVRHLVLSAAQSGSPQAPTDLISATSTWLDLTPPCPLALWIGPEGGFDESEMDELSRLGAQAITLGPLVLRTELAAVAALAVVNAVLVERGL